MLVSIAVLTLSAAAQEAPTARQSLDDAWWTGPMLAPSAATLPRRHLLIEPYLYDVSTQGYYDRNGVKRTTTHANGFGNLTYINYGLFNRLTIGMIPTEGFNTVTSGPSSSGIHMGDLTVQAQYRLTQFKTGRRLPTMSVAFQETLPTGRYDRLGNRPSDGLGSGAYTTTIAFYAQTYFWLPSRRI
ncbi:MAG TPA: transporter, partial [Terriglobales bacterium]|nr:transporter [Terriglobales bacterium]